MDWNFQAKPRAIVPAKIVIAAALLLVSFLTTLSSRTLCTHLAMMTFSYYSPSHRKKNS